jgi:phosphoenolpyruvate carboxylase
VEQSLWSAVPNVLRRMSAALKKHTGRELPLNATPIKFGSWMGGDRWATTFEIVPNRDLLSWLL